MNKVSLKIKRFRLGGNLPPVWVTYIAHRKVWLLIDFYIIDLGPRYGKIEVPQNFEFDLASIPRPIWPLISPFELSLVAPLIHDYLYQKGRDGIIVNGLTRKDADDIFLMLMLREKVPTWKANAAYRAVRWFGPRWNPLNTIDNIPTESDI